MTIQRMDHVGIVVDDLAAATAFFVELGLVPQDDGSVEGDWVDRIVGLDGVRTDLVMLQTPDGNVRIELVKFHAPPSPSAGAPEPANALGIRHLAFLVDDVEDAVARARTHGGELVGEIEQYRDLYRLCYVRGPAGIIVELAQRLS